MKVTIRPIGRHHPRSSSLPHVDTGPTVSFIFGTLPGTHFLSECQALSAILQGSPPWYQTDVLLASVSFWEIRRSHSVPYQGSTVGGGWHPICVSSESAEWGRKCETWRCHGEAARSVLAKVLGDVFACFHVVDAKLRSTTRNSQFNQLGPVLRADTAAVRIRSGTSEEYFR
jgi:hypothetical protein